MSKSRKKGIIFAWGDYPIGSAALRIRMWHYGLMANGIETRVIIAHPVPSCEDINNSEDFVHFMHNAKHYKYNTNQRSKRGIGNIAMRLTGIIKGYYFLKKNQNCNFVLLYGYGLFEGLVVYFFCKKNNVKFFAERMDENRRKYVTQKTFIDHLVNLYEVLFDKFVLDKTDTFFVVSEFLEKKYKRLYPNLKIKRSTPSFIDLKQFNEYQNNNLFTVSDKDFSIFKKKSIKVVFAGSCIFTNGLEFFLKCASNLIAEKICFDIVLVFFKGHVDYIRKLILQLNILQNVTIIEDVYYPLIPAIYNYSDILVIPEMGEIVANAGFPGKTAEYLASGKAIITTDFSNLKDYLIHDYNCMMSPIGDYEKYTNNLKLLVLDEKQRLIIGKNALATSIKYFDFKKGVLPLIEEL